MFESSVNSYDGQSGEEIGIAIKPFESSVNSYDGQSALFISSTLF